MPVTQSNGNLPETLALVYIQSLDLSGKKPAEIYDIYEKALEEFKAIVEERKQEGSIYDTRGLTTV